MIDYDRMVRRALSAQSYTDLDEDLDRQDVIPAPPERPDVRLPTIVSPVRPGRHIPSPL